MKSPDSRYYVEVQNSNGRVTGCVIVNNTIETLTKFGKICKLVSMKFIPAPPKYI